MGLHDISAPAPITKAVRLKSLIGGSIGHFVEWYDWFAYSTLALYFAPTVFPKGDATAQLVSAAAIFAIGFLARPAGAWLIGVYSDRKGRRAALALCVILMGGGSLLIALTPSYETAGIFAPIILLVARIIQGVSVGGESGASSTYVTEMAPLHRRGFWASFSSVNLSLGQLSALVVLIGLQAALPAQALEAWGWRLAFVIGAVFALVALWLRVGIAETESFEANKSRKDRGSIKDVARHWKPALIVFGLTAGAAPLFYAFTSYLQKYLVNTAHFSKQAATQVAAASLVAFILLQPIGGMLADRFGRKPMLLAFGVLATVFTVPLFNALHGVTSVTQAFWLACAALSIVTCYTAISSLVKAELFPPHIRTLGSALPFALAQSLVTGTVEVVALRLKQIGHEPWFYGYVAMWSVVFLVVAILTPETAPGRART